MGKENWLMQPGVMMCVCSVVYYVQNTLLTNLGEWNWWEQPHIGNHFKNNTTFAFLRIPTLTPQTWHIIHSPRVICQFWDALRLFSAEVYWLRWMVFNLHLQIELWLDCGRNLGYQKTLYLLFLPKIPLGCAQKDLLCSTIWTYRPKYTHHIAHITR